MTDQLLKQFSHPSVLKRVSELTDLGYLVMQTLEGATFIEVKVSHIRRPEIRRQGEALLSAVHACLVAAREDAKTLENSQQRAKAEIGAELPPKDARIATKDQPGDTIATDEGKDTTPEPEASQEPNLGERQDAVNPAPHLQPPPEVGKSHPQDAVNREKDHDRRDDTPAWDELPF